MQGAQNNTWIFGGKESLEQSALCPDNLGSLLTVVTNFLRDTHEQFAQIKPNNKRDQTS